MHTRFTWLRRLRRLKPRTFQARLSVAFVTVIALTLALVSIFVLNRLDDYFTRQQEADLKERLTTVSALVKFTTTVASRGSPVIDGDGLVNQRVLIGLEDDGLRDLIADQIAQADVIVRIGTTVTVPGERSQFLPASNGMVFLPRQAPPDAGQARERTSVFDYVAGGPFDRRYTIEVTLADPYTYRATAINNVTGLLAAIGLFALGLAVVVSAALARRFTTPIRQLTDASRALAEGDLTRRVPAAQLRAGASELGELAVQFNTMADRLAESVELIRRDRDRSRDFLADVSHELRTPLAALRTFNQLLMESAGDDPEARTEFLESSAGQIERLDWLAQNLLELSKLDSGLVLLDLRPDDLRAAVEFGGPPARRPRRPSRGHGRAGPALDADQDPPRSAADRPGRREPRRQRGEIHAARRGRAGVGGVGTRRRTHRRDRHGRRDRRVRAAPYLRALLPRIPGQRGAGFGQRARPRDRPVDRRHARRHRDSRERTRDRQPVHGPAAERSTKRGGHACRPAGGRGVGGRGERADRRRDRLRSGRRCLRRLS